MRRFLFLVLLASAAMAADPWRTVALNGPLSTMATAPGVPTGTLIAAEVDVPADAPADLGAGLWLQGLDGAWFQRLHGPLPAGQRTRIAARLTNEESWRSEPPGTHWSAWHRHLGQRWGVFFWSTRPGGQVAVRFTLPTTPEAEEPPRRLLGLSWPATATTGQRWTLAFRPDPYPWQPFDPTVFRADLDILRPDQRREVVAAFHDQPRTRHDRGDAEVTSAAGPERFLVRWRPRIPGTHHLRLRWSVDGGDPHTIDLGPVEVTGAPWDDYVRTDAQDPRFLTRQGGQQWWWPIGLNLQSVHDQRIQTHYPELGLRITPDRGTFAYASYLERLAHAGGDATEVWLCSWNLALEWSPAWPGQLGLGRYSQVNANRLDQVLDDAWARGIRVVLNLNNHAQVLPGSVEDEWPGNPLNQANGGPLIDPDDVFTHPQALTAQANLRRYLAARYADHPAVVTWKLWSEVDLTSLGIKAIRGYQSRVGVNTLRQWHEAAAADWKSVDPYQHPVSTHFATTYQLAHPRIAGATGIDLVLIDAYYRTGVYNRAENLAGLMADSSTALHPLGRPFLATEYGGGHEEYRVDKLEVEHASGGFLALVTGQAGAPMLWWREWVDQRNRWEPYGALRRFVADEDLRGREGRSLLLAAESPGTTLWCRAWTRPGRILLYLQDKAWSVQYQPGTVQERATIRIGEQVAAGSMTIAWWDADRGVPIHQDTFHHPGGRLVLTCPPWRRHLAAKLLRNP